MTTTAEERQIRNYKIIAKARSKVPLGDLVSEFGLGVGYIRTILKTAGVDFTYGPDSLAMTHSEKRDRKAALLADAANGLDYKELSNKYSLAINTVYVYCQGNLPRLVKREQTVTCSVCGESHTAEQKTTLRKVCAKPACRMTFGCARDTAIHTRNLEIVAHSVEGGLTLQAIGSKYGISRERVRQVLTEYGARPSSKRTKQTHCEHCSAEINYVGKFPGKYCSDKCQVDGRKAAQDTVIRNRKARVLARDAPWAHAVTKTYTCDGCGTSFERSNYIHSMTRHTYAQERLSFKRMYCSRACYIATGLGRTRDYTNSKESEDVQ